VDDLSNTARIAAVNIGGSTFVSIFGNGEIVATRPDAGILCIRVIMMRKTNYGT
jgi:hypothetical protein